MNDTNSNAPLFQVGQRVRILPNKNYPPTNAKGGIRYGIIQGSTQHPGMNLMNVQLPNGTNAKGEWAYIVASYHSPNAGAMWFTAAGLQPMKRDRQVMIKIPCPHCGREEENRWFSPCPSDDCPSHKNN